MENIENLINPTSVAIIGASADPGKIGYQIVDNLVKGEYGGEIYPVNPKGGEILGMKVSSDIQSIGKSVDLAIIVIPAKFTLDVVNQCAEAKVKSIIIISAGFAEVGSEGAALQKEVVKICNENSIAMLGPNCLGFINTSKKLNASFAQSMPKQGNISFISQSGAMISALIDWSNSAAQGFNKIFSMGNKADINEETALNYLYNDPETKVIIAYLERLQANDELTNLLIKYADTKPTIVLFGGKTSFGAQAASSHTGSMISSYLAIETYLKQAGIIIANDLSELFAYCQLFSNYQEIGGRKIAIVTNAGGPGIVTCDSLFEHGLNLASISEETKEQLKNTFRPESNINNPIDILGDASDIDYSKALQIVKSDKSINGIIVLLTPQTSTKINETASVIAAMDSAVPIVSAFLGGENMGEAKKIIENSGKPCFNNPDDAVIALRALVSFNERKTELSLVQQNQEAFDVDKKTELLEKFNLPVLKYYKANTFDELKKYSEEIGYPVVLKTAKPEVLHKSDSGGVKLNLKDEQDLKVAYEELGSPVIVGKMVKGDHELFLGIKKDASIGTVVAFGTGGIFSEIYKDISYRISPLTNDVAKEMILETKMGAIIQGARGQKKFDLDKLSEIIVNAARFADNYKNIKEIDFNPVIAAYPDFYFVDVRIIEE